MDRQRLRVGDKVFEFKAVFGDRRDVNGETITARKLTMLEGELPTEEMISALESGVWELLDVNGNVEGHQAGFNRFDGIDVYFTKSDDLTGEVLQLTEHVQNLGVQLQEKEQEVTTLNQSVESLNQEKTVLVEEKQAIEEEKEALIVEGEGLKTNIRGMKASVNTFLKSKDDDVLVQLLDLMMEWSLMDEVNKDQPSVFEYGDVRKHSGHPYTCIQGHSTDGDINRAPDKAAALWAVYHAKSARYALPWVAPTHAGDIYRADEFMVWTDEAIYKCLQDTEWGPDVLPGRWREVDAEGNPVVPDEPDEPDEPENPGEPQELNSNGTVKGSLWVNPNGDHSKLYGKDDEVVDEGGQRWLSNHDNNGDPPSEGWWRKA